MKSKRKLLAIEGQYASLKKLKMVARRGRCHQVTYKPRITTHSEDEFESEFLIEKPDKINRLLQYGLDQSKK